MEVASVLGEPTQRRRAGRHSIDQATVLLVGGDRRWTNETARRLDEAARELAVETARGLDAGIDRFAALDPDCVVCAHSLGDGTGFALLETVRTADAERPFLLAVDPDAHRAAATAIDRRATEYVRRDRVAPAILATRVRAAIRRYRTERALQRTCRRKTALLDLLTSDATATEAERLERFCAQLVEEWGYACAWIGTDDGSATTAPDVAAGRATYLDDVVDDRGVRFEREPSRLALRRDDLVSVAPIEATGGGRGRGSTTVGRSTAAERSPTARRPADGWRGAAARCGFDGAVAVPVHHGGVRYGVLAAYTDDSTDLDGSERADVRQFASAIGHALAMIRRKRSLCCADPVRLTVEIRDPSVPLVALASALPDSARIETRSAVTRPDGTTHSVARVAGVSPSTLEATGESLDSVRSITVTGDARPRTAPASGGEGERSADPRPGPIRCEILASSAPATALAAVGARFERTAVEGTVATVSVLVPDDATVQDVVAVIEDRYDDARVSAIWSERTDSTPSADGGPLGPLTDRQREVLRHAYHGGYFDLPRGISATELAERLGVTRATTTQHLRTAQRKLLGRLFGDGHGDRQGDGDARVDK